MIHRYDGYFVDLFVRASNDVAINMYKKFGYVTYRRVIGYYSGTEEEDALGVACAGLESVNCPPCSGCLGDLCRAVSVSVGTVLFRSVTRSIVLFPLQT